MTKRNGMTVVGDKQKAEAFDIVRSGGISPVGIIFRDYDELVTMPHDDMLREVVRRACNEALVFVLTSPKWDKKGARTRKAHMKMLRSVAKKIKAGRRVNG